MPPRSLTLPQIRLQLATRQQRFTKPRVIVLKDLPGNSKFSIAIPPPGTITLYYSQLGCQVLTDLAAAVSSADIKLLTKLGAALTKTVHRLPSVSEKDVLKVLSQADCVFDLRFDRKTLMQSVVLPPNHEFATKTFSFVGETLPENFEIVEHTEGGTAASYDYLVVLRPPQLTTLERAVLSKLPKKNLEVTIGPALAADTMQEVADIVRNAAEQELERRKGGASVDILEQLADKLEKGQVSAVATVQQLLRARRELMGRQLR